VDLDDLSRLLSTLGDILGIPELLLVCLVML
jgi:hypothetical protein